MYMHVFVQKKRENETEQLKERGRKNRNKRSLKSLSGRHNHFMLGPWWEVDGEKEEELRKGKKLGLLPG